MSTWTLPANLLDQVPDVFFPLLCNVLQLSESFNADGSQNEDTGSATPVPGLQDLKCRKAPITLDRPSYQENRGSTMTANQKEWRVVFKGYYPQIEEKMILEMDDERFNVVGIEGDSNHVMTRLRVERVTV